MLRRALLTGALTAVLAVSVLLVHALVTPAWAQQDTAVASTASMVSPFEGRCASCHDNRSPDSMAPSRQTLRTLEPERVLAALTTGPMVEFAEGFNET
ncbi:MAG TPA: hypothetical protein QGG47_08230 [Acidobacteriota bacterium]|nr:hypothetical protein [Acidobacteriota bacterium]